VPISTKNAYLVKTVTSSVMKKTQLATQNVIVKAASHVAKAESVVGVLLGKDLK
jgi:hypothetical protein